MTSNINASQPPMLLFMAGLVELESILDSQTEEFQKSYDGWNYYDRPNIKVIHTGMGAFNATCAANTFLKNFPSSGCLQIGFSGAHLPELGIGDIVLGTKVISFTSHTKTKEGTLSPRAVHVQRQGIGEEYSYFQIDPELSRRMKAILVQHKCDFHEGPLGGGDQFNRDPQFIQKIQRTFGTYCEDMESAAVAYAAARWNSPYLGIRIISNNDFLEIRFNC